MNCVKTITRTYETGRKLKVWEHLPAKKEPRTRDIVPSGTCLRKNYPCLHSTAVDGTRRCVFEII